MHGAMVGVYIYQEAGISLLWVWLKLELSAEAIVRRRRSSWSRMTIQLWHVPMYADGVELLTHIPSRKFAGPSIDGLRQMEYSCIVECQGDGDTGGVQSCSAIAMRGRRRHSHFNLASSDH